jgi:pre-mRNA-splicing factor ATP-dependent RNA helicase DHX15/PRP43
MSKRKIDLGDSEPIKKLNKDDSKVSDGGGLKPGLKMNPFTALPYTPHYFELFRKRIQLPVWEYQDKFIDLLTKVRY